MIDLYICDECHHSLTTDHPLTQPVGCPWCRGHAMLRQVVAHVDPVAMAKDYAPGTQVKHRLTEQVLMVLELEGDGSTGWFTARDKSMGTHRVRYVEVEVVAAAVTATTADPKTGQYL